MAAEGPLLHRRRLGAELRRLRDSRTLDEVADATLISSSKLSRLENGQAVPQPRDVRDLINYYELDGPTAERLRRWANAGRRQAWWKEKEYSDVVTQPLDAFIDFESGASTIRAYAASVLPGLLQTDEYAARLLRGLPPTKTEDQIRRLVEIRQRRRRDVLEGDDPARLIAVIDEAVLRREVGSQQERHDQLAYLHTLSQRRNISIQILPFEAGIHAGLMGMFTIFQFGDDIDRDLVSIEIQSGDRLLEEQSSVLEYLRIFDAISDKSLDNDESRALLTAFQSTSHSQGTLMISTGDFRKSTFSGNGGCVEIRMREDGMILLRDSKDVSLPPHHYTAQEWAAFLAGVRNGEFDIE